MPTVKPSLQSLQLLQEQRRRRDVANTEERALCVDNVYHFINTHCRIAADDGSGIIPFDLFPYQEALLGDFISRDALIILKARQLGITELVAAYTIWRTLRPNITAIIISQDDSAAKEFLRRARVIWDNLPPWLRVAAVDEAKTSTLEMVNGSRILPFPATERAGRSFTAQILVLDEWAQQLHQEEIYAAASPIIKSSGGKIIGISTARGVGNFYARQWRKAQEGRGMYPVFLPWHVRPGRDQEWYDRATEDYEPWQKAQEFPSNAEEAFRLSGRPRFDPDALADIAKGCLESPTVLLGIDGCLRTWDPPVPGRRYVCGADTAEGLPKGDYSTAVVLDWETGLDVAELHGHFAPEEFAHHLATMCNDYGSAFLGVERNNHGHAVLLALQAIEYYTNLYHHTEYDARSQTVGSAGWATTSKSKPIMIDSLAVAIRERRGYRSIRFVDEARTYAVKDNGDTGASGSLFDDRVIAYAIAEQVRRVAGPQQVATYGKISPATSRRGYRQYG